MIKSIQGNKNLKAFERKKKICRRIGILSPKAISKEKGRSKYQLLGQNGKNLDINYDLAWEGQIKRLLWGKVIVAGILSSDKKSLDLTYLLKDKRIKSQTDFFDLIEDTDDDLTAIRHEIEHAGILRPSA